MTTLLTLTAKLSQSYHQAMTDFRLADRMARLGTESAFEVLARAKAMEAAGHKIIHLEIGEPDFPTAEHIVEAAVEALRPATPTTSPRPASPRCARRWLPSWHVPAQKRRPTAWWSPRAPSRSCSSPSWPWPTRATRCSTRTPASRCTSRSPRSRGRCPSRSRCASERLPHRHRRTRPAGHRPDQAAHHQLTAQSVRQRADPRRLRGDRRHRATARPDRAHRRGVLGHPLRTGSADPGGTAPR